MSKVLKITIVGFTVVVVVSLGVFFSLFFFVDKGKTPLPEFNLSVNSWVGFGPFFLAKEKGFFEDEGIAVKISLMEDTAQRKVAMAKGDIDGLGDTVDLLVLSREEGIPSVAVMQVDTSNGADGILAIDAIKTVQDLKGKKIAVQKNFVSEAFLNYILKKNGLSPNDVQAIDTEAGAAGAAFVSGSVDVAVTFEPWLSKAQERRGGHILISTAEEPGVIVDILSVNQYYLQRHRENVKKLMRGWFKAINYWRENPQDANEIMAKYYHLTPQEFADIITGLYWPSYQENLTYFGTKENPGQIYDVADTFIKIFLETKQIKVAPDLTNAINDSLLRTLYEK